MIPRTTHSRSQLECHLNEYDDGAISLFVSCDTYPGLFDYHCPQISKLAPNGWRVSKGGKMKYLWFPAGALNQANLEQIENWRQRFQEYVLIGLSRHIAPGFSQELDFCMGLSFNYDPNSERRTLFGEALYQAKYRQSQAYCSVVSRAMVEAFDYLPVPPEEKTNLLITGVPSDLEKYNFGRELAMRVAKDKGVPLVQSSLCCGKSYLKNLPFVEKMKHWCELYERGQCVRIDADIRGRTVAVVDDLYQSGVTLWCCAKFLKSLGAKYVFGLVCVKSMSDTDNQ